MIRFFSFLFCISLLLGACQLFKKGQRQNFSGGILSDNTEWKTKDQFSYVPIDELTAARANFTSFTGRADIEYIDTLGKKTSLTGFFNIQKDSLIWISLRASILNIEGLRVLVSPDSLKILDKQNSKYIPASIKLLANYTGLPLDFYSLQNLLMGESIFDEEEFELFRKKNAQWDFKQNHPGFDYAIRLNAASNKIEESEMRIKGMENPADAVILQKDFEKTALGTYFATRREIRVNDNGAQLTLRMKFKKYSFNELLSFPFTVPESYKVEEGL